jgi:hypothetical protein
MLEHELSALMLSDDDYVEAMPLKPGYIGPKGPQQNVII